MSKKEELLIYDSKCAKRCKEFKEIDVCSPQECADLFGKPVKDGETIYYPKTKEEK